jgi:hypothetical protein
VPVDAHASLTVLAAQLQAVQTIIGSIEKRIVAQHRSNEASKRLKTIPGIGVVGATTITAVVTDRWRSDRVAILRLGSGSCRGRIRPAASRCSGRSRNRVTDSSGEFLLSEPILSCGVHASSRRSIPGSLSFSLSDRSRSSRSRWPTRWRGWPGRCWPGVGSSGRPSLWPSNKGLGNGRMRLRPCVHDLQGEDDIDAKRSRPSIGKTRKVPREERTRAFV